MSTNWFSHQYSLAPSLPRRPYPFPQIRIPPSYHRTISGLPGTIYHTRNNGRRPPSRNPMCQMGLDSGVITANARAARCGRFSQPFSPHSLQRWHRHKAPPHPAFTPQSDYLIILPCFLFPDLPGKLGIADTFYFSINLLTICSQD